MSDLLQRTGRTVKDSYEQHSQSIFRIAFTYLKNRPDAEDAVQETFLRLIRARPAFSSEEHEKAWLIRTASNVCRDMLKSKARLHDTLDDHPELTEPALDKADGALLAAVAALPERYRSAVYLHYYEGYSVDELAGMLRRSPNTIKTWLSRGRERLKTELGGDFDA